MSILAYLGYYFANEINAVPSLESMARSITRASADMTGAISGFFQVGIDLVCKSRRCRRQGFKTTSRSSWVDELSNSRVDDVVYSLPGP